MVVDDGDSTERRPIFPSRHVPSIHLSVEGNALLGRNKNFFEVGCMVAGLGPELVTKIVRKASRVEDGADLVVNGCKLACKKTILLRSIRRGQVKLDTISLFFA